MGKPVSVIGSDHFSEALKEFCCYGVPIRNRITRRLAGSMDICGHAGDWERLFAPLVHNAVRQIEQRLIETSSKADQRLITEYHVALGQRKVPIIALSDSVTMSSPKALDLVHAVDFALFHEARQSMTDREMYWTATLTSGHTVSIHARRVDGDGTLFELTPVSGAELEHPPCDSSMKSSRSRPTGPLMIVGEPGSGRTTAAVKALGSAAMRYLNPADIDRIGQAAWIRSELTAASRSTPTVIKNVDLLPDSVAAALADWLRSGRGPALLAMTCADDIALSARQAILTAQCTRTIYLKPLRDRMDELPAIVAEMIADRGAPTVHFTMSAMEKMLQYPWPGNLEELRTVVNEAISRRPTGGIVLTDLPLRLRTGAKSNLTRLEQLERDAIVQALRRSNLNKTKAAQDLGVSRRSLYNKLRALRIDTNPASVRTTT
ncbi:helix-turn-helix domain-containing protein [Mycobacterium vicinigordonae]|uniref:Sigma-54 factor interaction domain-containing protein n=1 Tax=Mycobacterium vicinigordonae TaxID=1719132 RepID=A0A7D6HSR7_9MYCO|nr:helix-turn-helix domain-containing protein [Mycobacterium vicinigordonae]QLL06512.1 hypothetical protein H0P51_22685 [Mycobacterium vicinigordonae]